ncbi:hypothetical protein DEM27_00145 [Metarhizobium album]|uniref:Uncharacterized protein n=1 Tax=Metarhizobium album TaxID=2182425 RepID=A0A2U2DWR6_9HYPH|nr:hypothetical protein [Rhizobium album]PWE57659.1 hypothetical protein DEM27_00145 [Rhizobium album]
MIDLSDTPAGTIARLDDALSRRGETVRIRRGSIEENVRAFVRKSKPETLGAGIAQGTRVIVFSPSFLGNFGGTVKGGDWIRIGDYPEIVIDERPEVIRMNGVIVRINATVTG